VGVFFYRGLLVTQFAGVKYTYWEGGEQTTEMVSELERIGE
jgi:hypothetical protein